MLDFDALQIKRAAHLGDNRKLFRLLYKASIIHAAISEIMRDNTRVLLVF